MIRSYINLLIIKRRFAIRGTAPDFCIGELLLFHLLNF